MKLHIEKELLEKFNTRNENTSWKRLVWKNFRYLSNEIVENLFKKLTRRLVYPVYLYDVEN